MNDLINFVHDNKPKIEMSSLALAWHWDVEHDIPEAGSNLYVVVKSSYGGGINEYRLFKNAELFIDEEDGHKVWLDEAGWNLLSVDEEDETRQIFVWAYMPDDMDIFPTSAMAAILQKKRWDNV